MKNATANNIPPKSRETLPCAKFEAAYREENTVYREENRNRTAVTTHELIEANQSRQSEKMKTVVTAIDGGATD